MKRLKIGLIGCGAIGMALIRYICRELNDRAIICGVFEQDPEKARRINRSLNKKVYPGLKSLLAEADLVVEAASVNAAANLLSMLAAYKKDALIMSVGAVIGREKLLRQLRERGINIYLPSGAICGIDGLKAAAMDKIYAVELTTRKPVAGFETTPYLDRKNIRLDKLRGEQVIFQGNAREAIALFPKNINVAAMLSVCGIGWRKTKVKIVADSRIKRNIHEINIKAKAANIRIITENIPAEENPRTSQLAILSAKALLKSIVNKEHLGT